MFLAYHAGMSFFMFETFAVFGVSTILSLSPFLSGGTILVRKTLSLENRNPNPWVNEVFSDNIVLTLRYLNGDVRQGEAIDFKKVKETFETTFTLKPGATFAFQNDVSKEFEGKVAKSTNATFNYTQGFRSSGFLTGDGVCHLASFVNQTAREAGLEVVAPTNHNFAKIPDVPHEFGTAIYYMPGSVTNNARQNLYITNNLDKEIAFRFEVTHNNIILTIFR